MIGVIRLISLIDFNYFFRKKLINIFILIICNFAKVYTGGSKIIGHPSKFRKRQRFLQAKKVLFLILRHICGHIIEVYHILYWFKVDRLSSVDKVKIFRISTVP